MGLDCWAGTVFTFEQCCVERLEGCWDTVFTYEACCASARNFARVLGDPGCFRGGTGGFYTYELCCLANSTECWDDDHSFERCCSKAVSHADPQGTGAETCVQELSPPGLSLWRPRAAGAPLTLLQEWDFGRLSRVTALVMFSLPGQPESEVSMFDGHFNLLADSGMGLKPYWGNGLRLQSPGGRSIFERLSLREPVSAYRVRLELSAWHGPEALLYAAPLGCPQPTVPVAVSVAYCQPLDRPGAAGIRAAVSLMADMYGWAVATTSAPDASSCFPSLDESLRTLSAQGRLGREAAAVLSPYLFRWDLQQHAAGLSRAAGLFALRGPGALAVLGFPTAGPDGDWQWPLRRVRRQYWKLHYSEYPTGSARRLAHGPGAALCHGGDAVSGSRIYSPQVLRSLLQQADQVPDAAWLVNLDLEAQRQGFHRRSFLCNHAVLPEDDYLLHATLTDSLAARYDVEAAVLHPARGLHVNCQVTLRHADPKNPTVYDIVNDRGLVTPWCYRRAMRSALSALAGWWLALSPQQHFVVASDGTALSLFRNRREPIPWDGDVDVQLYAEGEPPFNFGDLTRWSDDERGKSRLESPPPKLTRLHELGFSWTGVRDYGARGAGWHVEFQFSDSTAHPEPVHVELDAVLKAYEPSGKFPMSTTLAGVPVRFGQDLQASITNKYGPAEKRMHKDQGLITCRDPGHNACLPDCALSEGWHEHLCGEACEAVDAGGEAPGTAAPADSACRACRDAPVVECEFPDRFVELDFFH